MNFNLASFRLRLFGVLRFPRCVLGTSRECFWHTTRPPSHFMEH